MFSLAMNIPLYIHKGASEYSAHSEYSEAPISRRYVQGER